MNGFEEFGSFSAKFGPIFTQTINPFRLLDLQLLGIAKATPSRHSK